MIERKEQLAFRLDKIYFLKRHSNDAFKQLNTIQQQTLVALANEEGGPV